MPELTHEIQLALCLLVGFLFGVCLGLAYRRTPKYVTRQDLDRRFALFAEERVKGPGPQAREQLLNRIRQKAAAHRAARGKK